tara:strand:+ start:136 stop:360 length:225 start_codon:yes stop_codon:yes gene_type:complete
MAMITGIPSLHNSALDLSQQARRSLHDSIAQPRRPDAFHETRLTQVTALQQAHLSDLILQLAEERDRALLDVVA